MHEVQLLEADQPRKLRYYLVAGLRRIEHRTEEAQAPCICERTQALGGILATRRACEHIRIEVRGQHAYVPARNVRDRLEHGHRDRIRLLAGRAAGGPDADA